MPVTDSYFFMNELLKNSPEHDYTSPKYDSYLDENGLLKIDVALAGYSKDNIEVLYSNQKLIIKTAEKYEPPGSSAHKTLYFNNCLSRRKFKLQFDILKPYKVVLCTFRNGILSISMELPEEFNKNAQIEILD